MKVYVATRDGEVVVDSAEVFAVARLKKDVFAYLENAEIDTTGINVVKMDITKLEKGGSLPENAIKCYAVVNGLGEFLLEDGLILIARTKVVLTDTVNASNNETVVRAVLY